MRAEVDRGGNNGLPQTPSVSKSVVLWQRARDKPQCTHTNTQTHTPTSEEKMNHISPRSGRSFSEVSHGHLQAGDPLDNGETPSLACVWLLITRSVGTRSVTDALKWLNSMKLLHWRFFNFFCVPALVLESLSLLSDAHQRRNLESWLVGYELVGEWVVTG